MDRMDVERPPPMEPLAPAASAGSAAGDRHGDLDVLVVENDPAVAEILVVALKAQGYRVRTAARGTDALDLAGVDMPDVVILDLSLPDLDGIDVCRRFRRLSGNPVIVLSADGSEQRKIAALDSGADDYVTKPFSMPELLARLRVAERHRRVAAKVVDDRVLVVGDVMVDTAAHVVSVAGTTTPFTRNEFALLSLLARNAGKVLTHGAILDHVWGRREGGTGSLRMHVLQLRRKLGTGASRPQVVTVPGTGYRFLLPDPPHRTGG